MTALWHRLFVVPALSTLALLLLLAHGATAQSATGTVTGRVVWGPCIRGIPLPLTPDAQTQPPDQPVPLPAPGQPIPANGLPAGETVFRIPMPLRRRASVRDA